MEPLVILSLVVSFLSGQSMIVQSTALLNWLKILIQLSWKEKHPRHSCQLFHYLYWQPGVVWCPSKLWHRYPTGGHCLQLKHSAGEQWFSVSATTVFTGFGNVTYLLVSLSVKWEKCVIQGRLRVNLLMFIKCYKIFWIVLRTDNKCNKN